MADRLSQTFLEQGAEYDGNLDDILTRIAEKRCQVRQRVSSTDLCHAS